MVFYWSVYCFKLLHMNTICFTRISELFDHYWNDIQIRIITKVIDRIYCIKDFYKSTFKLFASIFFYFRQANVLKPLST